MSIHVQCRVQRGRYFMVTWLPKDRARVGAILKLKDEQGQWSDGWCVVNTYTELPTETVLARSRDHKNHRKATDV